MQYFLNWCLYTLHFKMHCSHVRVCLFMLNASFLALLSKPQVNNVHPLFKYMTLLYDNDYKECRIFSREIPNPPPIQTERRFPRDKKVIDAVLYRYHDDVPNEFKFAKDRNLLHQQSDKLPSPEPKVRNYYTAKRNLDYFLRRYKINENGRFDAPINQLSPIPVVNTMTDAIEIRILNMNVRELYARYFSSMPHFLGTFPRELDEVVFAMRLTRGDNSAHIDALFQNCKPELLHYFLKHCPSKYAFLTAQTNMWRLQNWAFIVRHFRQN
jgi:hypothetical protein